MMANNRDALIVEQLLNDFSFKQKGGMLRDGYCPSCNKKSLWIHQEKPRLIRCNRENNCGYTEAVTDRYPELFKNYSERCPATPEDPNRTAREYLEDRGFNPGIIAGWYEQGAYLSVAPTVRVHLWDGAYWERLIDDQHVRKYHRKTNYPLGTKKKGRHWEPPGQEIHQGDAVVITEGIFNAWAFLHMNQKEDTCYKAVSALDSANFPTELVESNLNRNIVWILAYDNDAAGLKHLADHILLLKKHNEVFQVCLTETSERDWADEWKQGRLTRKYMETGFWRGRVATAPNSQQKAFWLWAKFTRGYIQVSFNRALYAYKVDSKATEAIKNAIDTDNLATLWTNPSADVDSALMHFVSNLSGERISNCMPRFLYIERDPLTEEQDYFFDIQFRNGNQRRQIALDGSCLESASSFNKALLNKTSGGTFDGDSKALKQLKEDWFDHKTVEITRCRFVGYDKDTGVYVFPEFGYYQGRYIPKNKSGFIDAGKHRIKTRVTTAIVHMEHNDQLNESWIGDFHHAFGDNGLIVMAWWLMTLFAEQIRARHQDWPFMELTGDPGTGKTTLIKFLWKCCGRMDDYEGFDPNKSSMAGRSRSLERYSNLPAVVIEADRADKDSIRKKSFDFNEFKDFYNGGIIRTTGVKNGGNETVEPHFKGGVLIAQNASIESDDDAVMERIVHCHSTKAHHKAGTKSIATRLARMKGDELGGWLHKALTQEKAILEVFAQKAQTVADSWHNRDHTVRDRIVENHAKIAAGVWCLQKLFPRYMTDDKCQHVERVLWDMAGTRERRIKSDTVLVEQFWEYFEFLNYRETEDFDGSKVMSETLNHSGSHDLIAIHLQEFEAAVSAYKLERLPYRELKKQLPSCISHPFLGCRNVKSQILGDRKTKYCWVFQREPNK
ncbi:toprim domain-containing protein [Kistimonas scapharcae]|uniref:Toprim domain-containing protein n=1 Tax=Kistimonas scapharcae TaxID=1036133 RepID=A0ABP8V143_9GAMM